MNLLAIDHVQLAIPEGKEAQARSFYGDLLGMTELPKPPALAGRGGAWFESGNVRLHLGVETDFHPARKAHPALLVDELAGFILRVRAAGFEVDDSQPPLDGCRRAHVYDPFGNRIELMEQLA
jgi:catechol 2,3-dioxygenase-like lactoylglutathione lyase family enzyme